MLSSEGQWHHYVIVCNAKQALFSRLVEACVGVAKANRFLRESSLRKNATSSGENGQMTRFSFMKTKQMGKK